MPSALRQIDNHGKPDAWSVLVRLPPSPARVVADYVNKERPMLAELAKQAKAEGLVRL